MSLLTQEKLVQLQIKAHQIEEGCILVAWTTLIDVDMIDRVIRKEPKNVVSEKMQGDIK